MVKYKNIYNYCTWLVLYNLINRYEFNIKKCFSVGNKNDANWKDVISQDSINKIGYHWSLDEIGYVIPIMSMYVH